MPGLFNIFIIRRGWHNFCQIFLRRLCGWDGYVIFVFWSIDMTCYINWFQMINLSWIFEINPAWIFSHASWSSGSSPSGIAFICMLVCLRISHISLRLCLFFFISLLCTLAYIISINLSSRLLFLSSTSSNLLLIPSSNFFYLLLYFYFQNSIWFFLLVFSIYCNIVGILFFFKYDFL